MQIEWVHVSKISRQSKREAWTTGFVDLARGRVMDITFHLIDLRRFAPLSSLHGICFHSLQAAVAARYFTKSNLVARPNPRAMASAYMYTVLLPAA